MTDDTEDATDDGPPMMGPPEPAASVAPTAADSAAVQARIRAHVVGRHRELELALAAVAAGRDLVLEGPPGTSKTTMLGAITAEWGIPLLFVEGNADLTPAKLVGHHSPARVLREDYSADTFVPGPLVRAMREGGFLYIEELNRAPEDTLNTLLAAMADRSIAVPRVGVIDAADTFRVVASMNPFDNVGTTRLSMSVRDRFNRIVVGYQDAAAEEQIVALRAPLPAPIAQRLISDAVALTRATRAHELIRQGSSVRGAIDLARIAGELAAMRGVATADADGYAELVFDAMLVALSGRIRLDDTTEATPEEVLREIWEDRFVLEPAIARGPTSREVPADGPVVRRRNAASAHRVRPKPKELTDEPSVFEAQAGAGGLILRAHDRTAGGKGRRHAPAAVVTGCTDDPAQQEQLEQQQSVAPEARRRARQIARALSVPRPSRSRRTRRGAGALASLPYQGGADDIDIDATLEALAENPRPEDDDIIVRDRTHATRSVVLIIDVSGSFRGERIMTSAALVGALAGELARDRLAVIAFWSDAAVLAEFGQRLDPQLLLDRVMAIPARGLTNIEFPLRLAAGMLANVPTRDARAVLFSDCVHNAGPDPRTAAAALPRLDVLVDVSGESDVDLGRGLAARGHGVLRIVRGYREVAPALGDVFRDRGEA
ncbi:hypothetical protein GCM10022240_07760 [Microbacterium kribbense]|uniref:VWFA domain-containing protein n=1 Tax=Microbacterium kribbense TaxID=433645 RepID=A0ABP7G683_9MICO